MDFKRNEATLNRPEGDRVIDAPYLFADLKTFIAQVKEEKAWSKSDRNGITLFKSEGMTIVLTALKEGAVIKDNTVNGLFTIQVIEGRVRVDTPEGDIDLKRKRMIVFHPGVPHSIEAGKDTVLLLTSTDVRGSGTEHGVY